METKNLTRGIRNNNPLNIKISRTKWVGKITKDKKDHVFEEFDTMVNGLRAAIKLVQNYIKRMRLNTVEDIISRWCPDETREAYISNVTKVMETNIKGFTPSTPISWYDFNTLYYLIQAMAWQESRVFIDIALFYEAWQALDPHTQSKNK